MPAGEVQPIGRHETGGIHQHLPSSCLGFSDPLQRMLNTREIRRRWIGEQARFVVWLLLKKRTEQSFIATKFWRDHGQVGHRSSFCPRELADAVDGIVVIEQEQKLPTRTKGIRLTDQLEGVCGIGGENDRVFVRGSMKKFEDEGSRPFVQFGHGAGGRIERVRVPKYMTTQQVNMFAQL